MDQTLMGQEPQNHSYFNELVGDGRKFKTQEDLARSKFFSDMHVDRLERENSLLREDNDTLRQENFAKARMEDLYNQTMRARQTAPQPTANQTPSFDVSLLKQAIREELRETQQQQMMQANFNQVQSKITEKLGPNYQTALRSKIEQLDLTPSEADDLARRKPTTFIKMLGLDESRPVESFQAPPVPNNQFQPAPTEKKTWSYFQKMKKEDPKRYRDKQTTIDMMQARMELGESFNDGDFDPNLGGPR